MLGSIIIFIIVLSLLILVHEAGHFFAARKVGIWVEEFGIGYPPRAIGKKIKETIYSINFLPFGGFVRLHGENSDEGVSDPNKAFVNKSKKERIFVVTAGVVMNFLLAILCFSIVYSFSGIPRQTERVELMEIAPDSPAETQGLEVGDFVLSIDGRAVRSIEEFQTYVDETVGERSVVIVEREVDGVVTQNEIMIVPRENPPEGQGALGVIITSTQIYFPPIWQRPFYGVYYGSKDALYWSGAMITGFAQIFKNLFAGQVPQDIAGPVGIFAITSRAASFGILSLINFIGIFSLNLAILNILPFPALDGGRLLFILIEGMFGKKVLPKIENTIHMVGMVVLLVLIFAITVHDVKRLVEAGGVSNFLDSLIEQSQTQNP